MCSFMFLAGSGLRVHALWGLAWVKTYFISGEPSGRVALCSFPICGAMSVRKTAAHISSWRSMCDPMAHAMQSWSPSNPIHQLGTTPHGLSSKQCSWHPVVAVR